MIEEVMPLIITDWLVIINGGHFLNIDAEECIPLPDTQLFSTVAYRMAEIGVG
ncbi:MAG: hypothetical protein JSR19_02890 [Proteobacteria bacterium]|nr:hypothetical protein [Pseudomonadota bacterium]HQR03853.1 hypothetical protein [Rhodocyclaceae bacterium]